MQSLGIALLEAVALLGVFVISVCLKFDYCPLLSSEIFRHNLHISNKRDFWKWGSQNKYRFEICYYWWVLRVVLIFNSKNMFDFTFCRDRNTYSLVKDFIKKVQKLINCGTIINYAFLATILCRMCLIRQMFLAYWLT